MEDAEHNARHPRTPRGQFGGAPALHKPWSPLRMAPTARKRTARRKREEDTRLVRLLAAKFHDSWRRKRKKVFQEHCLIYKPREKAFTNNGATIADIVAAGMATPHGIAVNRIDVRFDFFIYCARMTEYLVNLMP